MADSIREELERMVERRKWEVAEARREMERRKMFEKRSLKVMLPCNVCGNFAEFFVAEANKVCGECLREGRTKEDLKDRRLMEQFLRWKKNQRKGNYEDTNI